MRSEESLALGVAPVVAAHDAFGFLQSDAACGTRTRCGSSGWPPLSPPSRHRSARSPDCWRGGAPSTSGVTEPHGSGREHAPIAAVGRRKKLDCRMGLTEKSHFTVDVLQSSDLSTLGWSEAHSATVNPTVNRPKSVWRRNTKHTAAVLGRHGARKARRPDAAMRARLTLGGRRRRGDRPPRWPEKAKTKEAGPICSAAACRARRRWARSRAACRAQATTGAAPRTRDDSDHNETDDDAAQATCAW